jgi:replicative superfamily II helicase
MLQMIGRAGRPQYDCSGTAVIMTTKDQCEFYEKMVAGQEIIESRQVMNVMLQQYRLTEIIQSTSPIM